MSTRSLGLSDPLYDYLLQVSMREAPILQRLREETRAMKSGGMQISPEQGQLMALLVRLIGARRVLEIGTFTGYSALVVALALPEEAKLVCCDISDEFTQIARRYWKEAGVAHRIDLRIAPAVETLDSLLARGEAGTFDFAFIDADKVNYDLYYERALRLVRPGGLILVDNVLWSGSVINPDNNTPDTVALRALNEKLHQDERIDVSMLPVGDGLTFARKR